MLSNTPCQVVLWQPVLLREPTQVFFARESSPKCYLVYSSVTEQWRWTKCEEDELGGAGGEIKQQSVREKEMPKLYR